MGDYVAVDIKRFRANLTLMNTKVEGGKPKATQARQTLTQLMDQFRTEDDCKAFLRDMRWPNGVTCPRCKNEKVYELKSRPFHWQCANPDCHDLKKPKPDKKNTGYRFSVLSGSIFENTKFPLRVWFQVAYLVCQAKKGVSALQIHRQIGTGDYRTAWYMIHRLRAAMENETFMKLAGETEIDETYIGGLDKNRHRNKRHHIPGGHDKMTVIGAISRKGNVVARVIDEAGFDTFQDFVKEVVDPKVSLVSTDEHSGYRNLRKAGFPASSGLAPSRRIRARQCPHEHD